MLKVIMTESGDFILMTNLENQNFSDHEGTTVMIGIPKDTKFDLKKVPSPVLEELFHAINGELMFRDKAYTEQVIRELEG